MIEMDQDIKIMTSRERLLWLGIRQALLFALRAIEAYLDLDQSRPAKRYKEP